jgi:HAD superfamily hydrolase (TIGR01509 family)
VPLRAIVFDFDGVIADSEPLHFRTFCEILAQEGVELTRPDYYGRYLGFSDAGVFREIGADRGKRWDRDAVATLVARKAARLEELEREMSVLFPGAEAFVRSAAALVPIAIASGALKAEILRVLDRADLTRLFTAIVAAEDVSTSKPAPEPYARAVELLSASAAHPILPQHCIAIEDSRWGLDSARAAGLKTVAVTHSYDATALADADLVVASLASLNVTDLPPLMS